LISRPPTGPALQFESFGFAREAYKNMIRFLMKNARGVAIPGSEPGRAAFEEVRQELQYGRT
jgi:hypothetical protein